MTSSPESALLRGDSAARARPYLAAGAQDVGVVSRHGNPVRHVVPDAPLPERRAVPENSGGRRGKPGSTADPSAVPAAGHDDVTGHRPASRLRDVYAEELARLRADALEEGRRVGHATGYAEGIAEAAAVIAQTEEAAARRLAEAQQSWERRWATASAALGNAAQQLDAMAQPVLDEFRDQLLDNVFSLVEALLGRELAAATDPGLDAARRALTVLPGDVPIVVRLHPDDLATLTPGGHAAVPGNVTVVGDPSVERGGALAQAGPRRVDAQLGPALDRVRQVLLP